MNMNARRRKRRTRRDCLPLYWLLFIVVVVRPFGLPTIALHVVSNQEDDRQDRLAKGNGTGGSGSLAMATLAQLAPRDMEESSEWKGQVK